MESTEVKYPEIEVQLTGRDGNAFAIIAAVTAALKRAGISESEIDGVSQDMMSGDYDHLLQVAMRTVTVL